MLSFLYTDMHRPVLLSGTLSLHRYLNTEEPVVQVGKWSACVWLARKRHGRKKHHHQFSGMLQSWRMCMLISLRAWDVLRPVQPHSLSKRWWYPLRHLLF